MKVKRIVADFAASSRERSRERAVSAHQPQQRALPFRRVGRHGSARVVASAALPARKTPGDVPRAKQNQPRSARG